MNLIITRFAHCASPRHGVSQSCCHQHTPVCTRFARLDWGYEAFSLSEAGKTVWPIFKSVVTFLIGCDIFRPSTFASPRSPFTTEDLRGWQNCLTYFQIGCDIFNWLWHFSSKYICLSTVSLHDRRSLCALKANSLRLCEHTHFYCFRRFLRLTWLE